MSAPMKKMQSIQAFTYLVRIGSGELAQVWNTKQAMAVGYPMRWQMARVEGGVEFSAPWTKKKYFVKDSEIEKGSASVALEGGVEGKEKVKVTIASVAKRAPAFVSLPTMGSSLKIYHTIGEWAVESLAVSSRYFGKSDGQKIFKLKGNAEGVYTPDALIEIKALVTGVTFHIGKTDTKLAKGETRRVRFMDISGVTLTHGGSVWRLAAFERDENPGYLAAPLGNSAVQGDFKRALIGAFAASLLFGLITFLIPSPAPVAKLETLRVKIAKKKVVQGIATAAPKGDPRARDFSIGKKGSPKNPGRKGALAQSKKVSPAGRPVVKASAPKKAKVVAKAAPKAAPKAAMKKVAKAAPKSAPKSAPRSVVAVKGGLKKAATVAARPAPVQHSGLFKALSSDSFRRTAKGLAAGGVATGSASASDARRLGSASGSGRGDLGSAGGVETRSAAISGFGGGGNSDGDGGPGSAGAGYGRGSNSKVSGRGRSLVSMDTGAADVDEGLTLDQVGRVIHAHFNEIRYCNDSAALRANEASGIEGRLTAKFAINASGDVSMAGVGSSTVGDRRLHDCIVSRLKGWKFPKPRGGVTVAVAYPFNFKTTTR